MIASIAVLISISSMRNTECIELFLVMFQEYIIVSNKGPTGRVVYMSLWSSGQRELERREVLVLPPRGRVGWSVSLVWAFGESTR